MGHFRDSDRKTPDFMTALRGELGRRYIVTPLNQKDRFDHWEDDEIGNPPVETVTSFTVNFGPFLFATVAAMAAWPEGSPERIEIRVFTSSDEHPQWFTVITPTMRHHLRALGFERFGQWRATWPASASSIESIVRQLDGFHALPLRILREDDVPAELAWPGVALGADVAAAAATTVERTDVKDGSKLHRVVLDVGGPPHAVLVRDSGLDYMRWWKEQDASRVGVAASSPLTQDRIRAELESKPDPLVELREDDRWLTIGEVRLSKRGARLSLGFPHPLREGAHFEVQRFASGSHRGWAIIFVAAGVTPDRFVGWVPEAEQARAQACVDRLNGESAVRLAEAAREVEEGRAAQTLIYVQGSEYAPDDPVGAETIELTRKGDVSYELRSRGRVLRSVTGNVSADHVLRLHDALASTTFPAAAQKTFPPGASMCFLITDAPYRQMPVRLDVGRRLPGYGALLTSLSGLCDALRKSQSDELSRWGFVQAERIEVG